MCLTIMILRPLYLLKCINLINLGLTKARLISSLSLHLRIRHRASLSIYGLVDRSCLRAFISKGVLIKTLMRLIWQTIILK